MTLIRHSFVKTNSFFFKFSLRVFYFKYKFLYIQVEDECLRSRWQMVAVKGVTLGHFF